MKRFWPFKWPRTMSSVEPSPAGPFPGTNTAEALQMIVEQFTAFIADPPRDGLKLGDFADYSCNLPDERAQYGATIYLNRKMANRSMHQVANDVAQLLERLGHRTAIHRGPTGEFEVYVPWAFLNATQ